MFLPRIQTEDEELAAVLASFEVSLDLGLQKAKAEEVEAAEVEEEVVNEAKAEAETEVEVEVEVEVKVETKRELVKQVSFKLPALEDRVTEEKDMEEAAALKAILVQFNASLDTGLAKTKDDQVEEAEAEEEKKEEVAVDEPAPTADDVLAMISASLDVGLAKAKEQEAVVVAAAEEEKAEEKVEEKVEELPRCTEGFASRSTVGRPEVSVNAASEAADAVREAAVGTAMGMASEFSAAVVREAVENIEREQALQDGEAVAEAEAEAAVASEEGEVEQKGEGQEEAAAVEEAVGEEEREEAGATKVIETQLTEFAPADFWPQDLSVTVTAVDGEDGHPLFAVAVSVAGEVVEAAGRTHRFGAFRDAKNEAAKHDTHKANAGFPRTYIRNKLGVALTPAQLFERAQGLQAWINAMITAELPLTAADVLKAFLVLEGVEVAGEVAGEEQGEVAEVAEVELAKGDRPASPSSPVETKLSTTEQTEADRRSSLAQ